MAGREVPVSIRRTIVEVSAEGLNVTRCCADVGVRTWLFYDLRRRFADGTIVKIVNIIDDCTRLAVACRAVSRSTTPALFDTFTGAASDWGWPERVLNDNAKAHVALEDSLRALGISPGHPRPYHPQT